MRIVTRPDFDGIVCAVLLTEALNITKPVKWVEPNLMHRGLVDIRPGDIIANLAYDDRCSLWFDHHSSNRTDKSFKGFFKLAPSAAGIIFEYYKKELKRDYSQLVAAADKIDSANLSLDEVIFPERYPFIMLANTISDLNNNVQAYWNRLVKLLRTNNIEKILADPQVNVRSNKVIEDNQKYKKVLTENTRVIEHVSITDLRKFKVPPTGNRFLVFSLFPDSNVNIKIRYDTSDNDKIIVSLGHSIFNKTCRVDVGKLCSGFNGGGHHGAGSCSFPQARSEENIQIILNILLKNKKI